MPYLPDGTMNSGSGGHKTALTGQHTAAPKPLPPLDMSDSIKYIPSQMDPLACASTRAARQDPIRLMIDDAGVLLRLLPYVPDLISPFLTRDKDAELYPSLANAKVGFLQTLLALIQVLFLVMALPAFVLLPGGIFLAATVLCCLACYLITLPMQGPPRILPNMDDGTKSLAEQHKNERWVFVNGICTGHSTSQLEVDRLSKTFGRAVIGIHNKSYGILADLGMCLIQRAVAYHDSGVRLTYAYLKAILVDPTVTKVVLIGHSQGGIIVSLAIDDLLAQLPTRTMSKLEVYTFGSAASHFSNPSLALLSNPSINQRGDQTSLQISQSKADPADANQGQHVIPHMEHYANEYDLVPRWGVLHSVQDVLHTRYAGSVFVRMGGSGHMLNQHYLDPMFPLSKCQMLAAKEKRGIKLKSGGEIAGDNEAKVEDKFDELFLDRIVTPDERLAMQRDFTAIAGLVRRETGLEFGTGQVVKDAYGLGNRKDANGDDCLTFKRTASDRVVAEEARGKTVKDLSRLWKYVGGESPIDHEHDEYRYHEQPPHRHRKHHHDHHNQRKADRESGDGPVLEQPKSPVSSVFDRPESPLTHPSPTTDEQFFYWNKGKHGQHARGPRTSIQSR
ncbi:hypothetical protein HO173_010801 [Letharia columbiana]|uniref:DUF676 domain-containing protein n=1 Tax=Letharia columbiana TaxID=112416 RepID=A0A8H6FM72_9LECA|nr:uncharacterized protein HO173_010801 [Letharia columbiana]KAF6231101.1 hypothetical protein HO173_010801 [Letharia columbiana]